VNLFFKKKVQSSQQHFLPIVLTIFISFVVGYVFSSSLIFFSVLALAILIFSTGLFLPRFLIYLILFSTSSVRFIIPKVTFLSSSFFHVNYDGLRNMLVLSVSIPFVFFNMKKVRQAKLFFPIVVYLLFFTLTTAINFSIDNIRFYSNVISPIFFYFFMIIFIRNESQKNLAWKVIVGSSFIPILIGILQFYGVLPLVDLYGNIMGKRVYSTFDNANTFGVFIVTFSFISLFGFLEARGLFSKLKFFLYFVLVHFCVFITHSRNAIFSLIFTYFIIAKAKLGLIRAIFIGACLVVLLFSLPIFNQRIITPSSESKVSFFNAITEGNFKTIDRYAMGRLSTWKRWIFKVKQSSIEENFFGHGYKAVDTFVDINGVTTFHNAFLKTYWVNGGLCMISFCFLMVYIVFLTYSSMKNSFKKNKSNILLICSFAYAFATLFMANFDNTLEKYQLFIYFYALIALAEKEESYSNEGFEVNKINE
jgi:hypothetical protein